jgi:hypothetical protein
MLRPLSLTKSQAGGAAAVAKLQALCETLGFERARGEIFALDLSTVALETARQGLRASLTSLTLNGLLMTEPARSAALGKHSAHAGVHDPLTSLRQPCLGRGAVRSAAVRVRRWWLHVASSCSGRGHVLQHQQLVEHHGCSGRDRLCLAGRPGG